MFSNIQFALGVIFYYKSHGAGQALMVRDIKWSALVTNYAPIKAIIQMQKTRSMCDSI